MTRFFSYFHTSILIIMTMIFDKVSTNHTQSQIDIISNINNKTILDKICNEYDQKINIDIKKRGLINICQKL